MKMIDGEIYYENGDEVIIKAVQDVELLYHGQKGIVESKLLPEPEERSQNKNQNKWHPLLKSATRNVVQEVHNNWLYDIVIVWIPSLNEKAVFWRQHLLPANVKDRIRMIVEKL